MRVVVTGGAGFVGSSLVRHLANLDIEVLTIDKLTYSGDLASLGAISGKKNYSFLRLDICEFASLLAALYEFRPLHIYHLAAETHVDRSIDASEPFIKTNIIGTFTLLEAARHYYLSLGAEEKAQFRLIHVSTDEVYGSLGPDGLFTEAAAYTPSSPYSASKASSDLLVLAWWRSFQIPTLICNSSNNYGPFQFPEKLIPLMVVNAIENQPMPVYGDGSNVRDWLHVEDHARAIHLIGSYGRPGEKYNVGGRNERRNIDVIRGVCALLDAAVPGDAPHSRLITHVTDRPGHDHRYAVDPTKIETELGWRASVPFESGLEATVRWYLENEWWWRPHRDTIYTGERLGTY